MYTQFKNLIDVQIILKGITWSDSLSSSSTLSNVFWVSFRISIMSSNFFLKVSFSSLHSMLMHFGGCAAWAVYPQSADELEQMQVSWNAPEVEL